MRHGEQESHPTLAPALSLSCWSVKCERQIITLISHTNKTHTWSARWSVVGHPQKPSPPAMRQHESRTPTTLRQVKEVAGPSKWRRAQRGERVHPHTPWTLPSGEAKGVRFHEEKHTEDNDFLHVHSAYSGCCCSHGLELVRQDRLPSRELACARQVSYQYPDTLWSDSVPATALAAFLARDTSHASAPSQAGLPCVTQDGTGSADLRCAGASRPAFCPPSCVLAPHTLCTLTRPCHHRLLPAKSPWAAAARDAKLGEVQEERSGPE